MKVRVQVWRDVQPIKYRWLVWDHLRHDWVFHLAQLGCAMFAVYWIWRLPIPGFAIGVLAVIAAVMSLHADMKRWDKAVWIVLVGVFLTIEIQAIRKDRRDLASAETQRNQEELKQFQNIADTVTGGSAFCYATASIAGHDLILIVHTQGTTPLHEVAVDMIDLDVLRGFTAQHKTFTWSSIQGMTTHYPNIPFLVSGVGFPLATLPASGNRTLHFNFFSMNGTWGETLNLRLVGGQWTQAIKVSKEVPGNGEKVLFLDVPNDYPTTNGQVDW